MNKKKTERATKHLRIYPKTYEMLRRIAFERRLSLAATVAELAAKA